MHDMSKMLPDGFDGFEVAPPTPAERARMDAIADTDRRLRALVIGERIEVGTSGWIVASARRHSNREGCTFDAGVYKAGTKGRKLYRVEDADTPGHVKVREVLRDGNLALVPIAVGPLNVRGAR